MSNPNNVEVNRITMESIAIATAQRLNKGAFHKATISEICKTAGVSRKAYYRNFVSTKSALKYYLKTRWDEYSKKKQLDNVSQKEQAPYLTDFIYLERDFIRDLRENNMLNVLEELFMETVLPTETSGYERYYKYVVVYVIYGLIRAMVDNDFSQTPEEIKAMTEKYTII